MSESASSEASGFHSHEPAHPPRTRKELGWLSLGALGVVYGDIGTSPLYAMKECFSPASHNYASAADPAQVFGVLSLMIWSLLLVVVVKYLLFVLRADNKGEGGTLALASASCRASPSSTRRERSAARSTSPR